VAAVSHHEPTVDQVRLYWEKSPLLSHEVGIVIPEEHWRQLDEKKRGDIERFAESYWKFPESRGQRLLDIGCGPGWLTVRYSEAGAEVWAVDLTARAVSITKSVLASKNLSAHVEVANAEKLPFHDSTFDIVVSSGVLHHTPDVDQALAEAFRVTKPGGVGLITLYRKGILHTPLVFPIVRLAMRLSRARHPGADLARDSVSIDDFIRMYDGADNPVGVGFKTSEWRTKLVRVGWIVESFESHYFPLRMVPLLRRSPRWLHLSLDRMFGTMVYFTLRRSSDR